MLKKIALVALRTFLLHWTILLGSGRYINVKVAVISTLRLQMMLVYWVG
jgi:hypothetical protein